MNYDKIGEFIAKKRKEKNLTQKELALKIGVTDKAVSKWERGLGCPDVSILEVLANELDVSILEILKGRIIENEVIPVTEMNDYVKETVNYSEYSNRNKIKDIISKIITFIIVLTGSILIILNITHLIYLNYNEEYDFNDEQITKMKQDIKQIEENVDIIKNNQGKYSDEDYKKITDNLDYELNEFKNIKMLEYEENKKISIKDLYIMDLDYPSILDTMSIYQILEKYDATLTDYVNLYIDTFMMKAYTSSTIYTEPDLMYQYKLYDIPNENYIISPDRYRIQSRVYSYKYLISSYLYFTNTIIEVGEINE